MRAVPRSRLAWPLTLIAAASLSACGASSHVATPPSTTTAAATTTLPGAGKPPITVGDKNFTEQFVLGELYYQSLLAEGFSVQLNRNIGPTQVTLQALQSGSLSMYPEYLNVWNSSVAGYQHSFKNMRSAYRAAQRYAQAHGLTLLRPTPFSDTDAIGVTFDYAVQNGLSTIGDLRKVASSLTFGAPPQFEQNPAGLPALEQAYGFQPAASKTLEIGNQYQALDQGVVEAADVNTTDGALANGGYTLLRDPLDVLGWGNVVPVVSTPLLAAEGLAFAATIDRVSALLTLDVMRQLNAEVDISGEDPATVAKDFLVANGVLPQTTT